MQWGNSMEQIFQDRDTSLKKNIESGFIDVCVDVTALRSMVMNNDPGNIDAIFSEFRRDFDGFFTMSSDNKKIDKELVIRVDTWLNTRFGALTPRIIKDGIKLFTEYKSELFKQDIIKY